MPVRKVVILAIAAAAAESTVITNGKHVLSTSTDCWLKQGATGMGAATAGGAGCFFLGKGSQREITVDAATNAFISGIRLTADGHLSIAAVED